jgi:uncharacterized membrane protein YagU involved in acid resistance
MWAAEKKMFTMKSEVVGHLQWVISFEVLNKIFVKDGASKFHNIRVNLHKLQALFSARLSQLS